MKFEKLSEGKVSVVEKQISKKWGGVYDILNKTIDNRKDAPNSGPLNLIDIAIPFKVWFKSKIANKVKAQLQNK